MNGSSASFLFLLKPSSTLSLLTINDRDNTIGIWIVAEKLIILTNETANHSERVGRKAKGAKVRCTMPASYRNGGKIMKVNQKSVEVDMNLYLSAAREFLQGTFKNPNFFDLSHEEQKEVALKTIQKHKSLEQSVS